MVRHGQPFDESKTGGDGDPALSSLGQAQAAAVCAQLEREHIDHIVASPMVRARQTGEPLAAALGLEMEFDDDLKEAGWQAGAYLRTEENLDVFIEKIKADPEHFFQPEGRQVFSERVIRSFNRIASENPGKRVAVFCHGMVTNVLSAHALGILPGPDDLHPEYTSLTRVQASPSRDMWTLKSFNETMHLAGIE